LTTTPTNSGPYIYARRLRPNDKKIREINKKEKAGKNVLWHFHSSSYFCHMRFTSRTTRTNWWPWSSSVPLGSVRFGLARFPLATPTSRSCLFSSYHFLSPGILVTAASG